VAPRDDSGKRYIKADGQVNEPSISASDVPTDAQRPQVSGSGVRSGAKHVLFGPIVVRSESFLPAAAA
jgi:hypothetical protein